MDDIIRVETSLTIQIELEEKTMNAKSVPVAETVPLPSEVPQQDDERENVVQEEQQNIEKENQPAPDEQQPTDQRIETENSDDDSGIYFVVKQMFNKGSEDKKIEDDKKNKELKEKSMEEQQTKRETQEPPVEKPQPTKMEPQDLSKKRVRKGHSFSRRRHVYRRRSAVVEPSTSLVTSLNEDLELSADDDEVEEIPITEAKYEPGEGGSSGKKKKIVKLKRTDLFE